MLTPPELWLSFLWQQLIYNAESVRRRLADKHRLSVISSFAQSNGLSRFVQQSALKWADIVTYNSIFVGRQADYRSTAVVVGVPTADALACAARTPRCSTPTKSITNVSFSAHDKRLHAAATLLKHLKISCKYCFT